MKEENDKYLANPANIKRAHVEYDEKLVKNQLFDVLERNIADEVILMKYKEWINHFFEEYLRKPNLHYLKTHFLYKQFLRKYHKEHRDDEDKLPIEKFNVIAKIAKILQERLWNEAFDVLDSNGEETVTISPKSLRYIASIFFNVNAVWKERWGDLNQVFHDGDFPFIASGEIKSFDSYVDVLCYLLSHKKHNPFGKWWIDGDAERTKKTWQYSDMVWACTDPSLEFHTEAFLSRESLAFQWSASTTWMFEKAMELLKTEVSRKNNWREKTKWHNGIPCFNRKR